MSGTGIELATLRGVVLGWQSLTASLGHGRHQPHFFITDVIGALVLRCLLMIRLGLRIPKLSPLDIDPVQHVRKSYTQP